MVDKQAVIRALTKAAKSEEGLTSGMPRLPVVTISRCMGSGGDEIGRLVADRLGIPLYAQEILDTIAKETGVHKSLLNKLHERLSKSTDAWLYAQVFSKNVTQDDYMYRLVATVRGLYQSGGVILGRGANVILTGRSALRIRIVGSVDACAERLALQCDEDSTQAKKRVQASNKARSEFMWKLFKVRANDPTNFDMTINTDYFPDHSGTADIIIQAMEIMGSSEDSGKTPQE